MVVRYLEKAEISASEARKANNELKEQLANAKRQQTLLKDDNYHTQRKLTLEAAATLKGALEKAKREQKLAVERALAEMKDANYHA